MSWRDWVRSVEIEPSLYAGDFSRLGEEIEVLLDAGVRIFHFDVGDGHFVEPVTIGPVVLASISPLVHDRGGVLDCHLMVDNPERHIPQIAKAGGDSVTFHAEVVDAEEARRLVKFAHDYGLGAGLAFNPETAVADAVERAKGADLVLCMSIHPGYSGQQFMPAALDRLRETRRLLPDSVFLQVDGGIDHKSVVLAHAAGADLLVAGNAIFGREDLPRAYRRLVRALEA